MTTTMPPVTEWDSTDRLKVVAWLNASLMNRIQRTRQIPMPNTVIRVLEAIHMTCHYDAAFLNKNVQNIQRCGDECNQD